MKIPFERTPKIRSLISNVSWGAPNIAPTYRRCTSYASAVRMKVGAVTCRRPQGGTAENALELILSAELIQGRFCITYTYSGFSGNHIITNRHSPHITYDAHTHI